MDAGWGAVTISSAAEDTDHEPADDKVDEDDEHRGDDHRLGGRAAHTLGTAARVHAIETADAGNDETKNNWLYQALQNIGIIAESGKRYGNTENRLVPA